MGDALKGIGLGKMFDVDKMFERQSATHTKHVEVLQDKIDVNSSKKSSAIKLQGLINNLRTSIDKVANPYGFGAFDVKDAKVLSTTDIGVGTDYISVQAENGANLSEFNVSVNSKATAAKLTLQLDAGGGFDSAAPGLDGTLTLNVAGNARNVAVDNTQSIKDIVKKINETFSSNNDEFIAQAFNNNDGTSYIEIVAKETGVGGITHNYLTSHLFGGNDIDAIPLASGTTAGTDAQITVNGIALPSQSSNKFVDIPYSGVTIDILKENTLAAPLKTQVVQIKQDNSNVMDVLSEFTTSYNNLAVFVAQQSQKVGKVDEYSDPYKIQKSIYAEGADLHNESILREAQDLLTVVVGSRQGNGIKYKSLADVGIALEPTPVGEDNVITNQLSLKEPKLLQKALSDNLQDLSSLFANTGTVKADPANNGSDLFFTTAEKQVSGAILGKDVAISLTFDAAGNVSGMTATIDGGATNLLPLGNEYKVDATSATKVITFEGSPLEGIRLVYDATNAVAGTAENFTLNFTHGIADLAKYRVNNMVNENGKGGSVLAAIEMMTKDITNAEDEKDKVQETIDKMKQKIEREFDSVSVLEMMTSMQMDMIERILGTSSDN
jgi:hypothetical protein